MIVIPSGTGIGGNVVRISCSRTASLNSGDDVSAAAFTCAAHAWQFGSLLQSLIG